MPGKSPLLRGRESPAFVLLESGIIWGCFLGDIVLVGCRLCGGMGRVITDEFNQAMPRKAMPKVCSQRA